MPRNGSGIYTLPEPAFTPGTVISSTAMNSDLSDIALALTDSLSADGQTPITGGLKATDGSALLPSYSFITDDSDGFHHPAAGQVAAAIQGVDTLTIQAPSATVGGGLTGVSGAVLNPIGMLADFAGSTAPTGWFLCYGQAISRTTYVELFTVIGTTWGSGDGSTTFNLPDMRGRTLVGKDNMGGSAANRITSAVSGVDGVTLGAVGGEQAHTLVTGELASHSHTITDPGHTHTTSPTNNLVVLRGDINTGSGFTASTAAAVGISINSNTTGITGTNSSGSGTEHNNVQPTAIVNKIIFAGHP